MTYLAPRQGIFAAIVLLSLTLHLLFFVISTERSIDTQNQLIVDESVAALSQELVAPMSVYDRVSMSVIAEPYAKERAIGYVGIYDNQGNVLVPLGESSEGYRAEQVITANDQVLGKVVVQSGLISRAQILSENWVFLLSVIGLHIILWLAYGYIARPTAELKQQIANRVRSDLLNKGLLTEMPAAVSTPVQDTIENETWQAGQESADDAKLYDDEKQVAADDEPSLDHAYTVQLEYNDPNHLLAAVSLDTKAAYLALCNQLFDKTCQALLELPLFAGVAMADKRYFDDNSGAVVTLHAKDSYAKTAVAAATLAKLIVMVGEVVYQKHREIKRFALPIKAVCSDETLSDAAWGVMKNRKENLLVIFKETGRDQLSVYMQLESIKQPRNIHERDARQIVGMTNTTTERLKQARDKVLLGEDNA